MPVIPALWEAEVGGLLEAQEFDAAVSYDHATALQPEQQSDTPSQKISETWNNSNKKKVAFLKNGSSLHKIKRAGNYICIRTLT